MENKTKRLTPKKRRLVNIAIIAIVILAIVGLNFVAILLVDKFPALEADVTNNGAYSLNATTKEYLEYLDTPVTITVLKEESDFINMSDDAGTSAYSYQVNKLLKDMSVYKNIELKYMNVSAVSASTLSQQYPEVDWSSSNNLIIVESGDKHEILAAEDVFNYSAEYYSYYGMNVITDQCVEQSVLSSIQRITADELIKVAFSTGNGEFLNPESEHYSNFSQLKTLLEDNAYEVTTINLLTEKISEDIDAIVMLCPSADITNEQSEAINTWLNNDGSFGKILLYVPFDLNVEIPNTDLLLEQWGLAVDRGYIYEEDLTMAMSGSSTPQLTAIANYANDDFTAGLKTTTLPLLMPYGVNIQITDENVAAPMLTSSEQAKVAVLGAEEVTYEDNGGKALNYAAVGKKGNEDNTLNSHVIVWGACEGISSGALTSTNFNNASYVVNMFNTTLGNEMSSIVVEGATLTVETLTVNSAQQVFALVAFVIVVPLAMFATGIVVWVRRKNK